MNAHAAHAYAHACSVPDDKFKVPITKHDFSIPGAGEITDPEICGKTSKVVACSENSLHYKKRHKKNCGNIECPICFGGAVYRAAKTASAKIRGFEIDAIKKGLHTNTESELILNHYIISPPSYLFTPDDPYDLIKQKGRDLARKAGIWGGFMGFHPWRLKDSIVKKFNEMRKDLLTLDENGREIRHWEMVRSDILELGSFRKYVKWSPHFHAVGFGKLPDQHTEEEKQAVKKLYKGWIVAYKRHVNTHCEFDGSTRIENPIAELAFYIFSHAGLQKGKKIPVWLGELSQNKVYLEKVVSQEYDAICPVKECQKFIAVGDELPTGEFIPRVNSMTGEPIRHVLKFVDRVYVIGRRFGTTLCRRDRIWSPSPVAYGNPGIVDHSDEFLKICAVLSDNTVLRSVGVIR